MQKSVSCHVIALLYLFDFSITIHFRLCNNFLYLFDFEAASIFLSSNNFMVFIWYWCKQSNSCRVMIFVICSILMQQSNACRAMILLHSLDFDVAMNLISCTDFMFLIWSWRGSKSHVMRWIYVFDLIVLQQSTSCPVKIV